MPKSEPNYIPYYPPAPERHVFSPDRSISPELHVLSCSLRSLHVDDANSGHNEPPNSEDNVTDSKEDCNRTPTDLRPSSPSISGGSSELSIEEDVIPKPKGSLGKPGRGGYSLREALGWDAEEYRITQLYIRSLAQGQLDESISFGAQDEAVIAGLCRQADIKIPRLKLYKHRWATKDFLASYHKNSASGTRPNSRQKGSRRPSPHPSGGEGSSKVKTVAFEGENNQSPARRLRNRGPR